MLMRPVVAPEANRCFTLSVPTVLHHAITAESLVHPITSAFIKAAVDLGFSFEPSSSMALADGTIIGTVGLVHSFGSSKGTVLFALDAEPDPSIGPALTSEGYFYSLLSPEYDTYDRDLFAETLDDWQWFGSDSSRPDWYTGLGLGHC